MQYCCSTASGDSSRSTALIGSAAVLVEVTFQRKDRESGVEESITKQKSRGFGFVQFLCSRDAAKVVREHGVVQICGRDAAVDYAVAKKRFEEIQAATTSTTTTAATTDNATDADVDNDVAAEGESPAETDGENDSDSENDSDDGDDPDAANDSDADDDVADDVADDADDAGSDVASDMSEEEVKLKKPLAAVGPRKSDVGAGQTVFVRNLPFDADQSSLEECFSVYGTLRMALLVKDKETGESLALCSSMPKGTAFVKFQDRVAADRCLAAAEGVGADDGEDGGGDLLSQTHVYSLSSHRTESLSLVAAL
eukprot:6500-Heterococcus_DN1.PRE.3